MQVPAPTKVTTEPLTVQMLPALLVAKTTGLPEAPPVAVKVTGAAPSVTGDAGLNLVMVWVA